MAKKPHKKQRAQSMNNVVHTVFDDTEWHPLDDKIDSNRDKKYTKNVKPRTVGSSRVDLQACKLEYSIVSPK